MNVATLDHLTTRALPQASLAFIFNLNIEQMTTKEDL
jgi:hypothetical protein